MGQNLEDKIPNMGMNQDDENRIVDKTESRFIKNLRAGSSDGENVGAIENIKGNTEISFQLPAGVNKVIGSHGDQTTNSNFFFVWNSLGTHTIYRYFNNIKEVRILSQDNLTAFEDEVLNFTEFDLINDINVVEDLLYWRDLENPPRKINFNKADVDGLDFRQTFHWYLGDEYLKGEIALQLDVDSSAFRYSPVQISASHLFVLNPAITEKKEIAKDLAAQINALSVGFKGESCGEFVVITGTVPGYITITALKGSAPTAQVVPQNHYSGYIERTIDSLKYPPHCPLSATVKTDAESERNFIKNKTFQFAARYTYDDNEKSTVSPYSLNIYNKFSCEQFSGDDINNYIEIDLSVFKEINTLLDLQTIKRIELFVKEGELGLWKTIKTLEQYEFVDVINQKYNFYNNSIYDVVDQNDFVRPFDSIPQRTKNQEVVKNRMFYANNLEGYENSCVDANLELEYDDIEPEVLPPTYTLKGRIDIRAAFNGADDGSLKDHQPIWKDNIDDDNGQASNPTVFGGITSNPGPDTTLEDIAIKTGQILPLGGFVVYLAGTDFHGVSKQKPGTYTDKSDVSQDSNGVFVGSGNSYVDHVREYIREEDTYGELFSTFEIPNVPDGWYSLRVASHQTTQDDLDNGSRAYQRTSTNAFNFEKGAGGSTYTEEGSGRNELIVHVSAGNITNLQSIHINVMDLSYAHTFGSTKILSGYVVDSDIDDPDIDTFDEAIADTRMSRVLVTFDKTAHNPAHISFFTQMGVSSDPINDWGQDYWFQNQEPKETGEIEDRTDGTVTDHNGFFFFASSIGNFGKPFHSDGELSVENISPFDQPLNNSYNGVLYSQQGGVGNVKENNFAIIASRTPKLATFNNRSKVRGNISDQDGLGIPKASVVSNRTPVYQTDANGDYEFFHYGILNRSGDPLHTSNGQGFSTLIFPSQSGIICSANYDSSERYLFGFDYSVDWWNSGSFSPPPPNSEPPATAPTLIINTPAFEGDSTMMVTTNAFKRGGSWKFGIVYYDRGLRSGSVNHRKNLELNIPFYTEKDSTGVIRKGIPYVNWEVKNRPPSWATHWQWVRTRNETVGKYFQWSNDGVRYTDADGNSASFNSGTRVRISIENLSNYRNINAKADLEINLNDERWRIRFTKTNKENLFPEYIDVEMLEFDSANSELVIEKEFSLGEISEGTLFEAYRDELDIENSIYYEFGECFEVKKNSFGMKYHAGLSQDQNPLNPSSVPATGQFRSGDAYYRLRFFSNVTSNSPSLIDDDGISDFYHSEVESIGRPNAENPDSAQLWKINQIRHSGKYIPDSKVNNLSRFESSKFNPLPIEYGEINKLQLASNVLMSIHELRWVSNYIEEVITRKQAGGDDLKATTDVFGSFRAVKQITGTENQESVKEYKGAIYAFDVNKGQVYRWGGDGLTPISHNKMINYFTDKSRKILELSKESSVPSHVLGIYDPKFDEYILSFNELFKNGSGDATSVASQTLSIPISNSETIETIQDKTLISVVSKKGSGSNLIIDEESSPDLVEAQIDNRADSEGILRVKIKNNIGELETLVTLEQGQGIQDLNLKERTFLPKQSSSDVSSAASSSSGTVLLDPETIVYNERIDKWTTFLSINPEMYGNIDLEIISFLSGKLWLHNSNDIRNNFYGVQYTSQIEAMFNELPGQVKVFQSLGVESGHPWSSPSAKTPNGMETEIVSGRFVRKEDSFFAPVMRDKNDPTFIGKPSIDAIINGRQLRARSIKVLLENNEVDEVVLFAVSMMSTLSSRHQK